jgi:uncharacterized protein YbbC (DUF1343 family)
MADAVLTGADRFAEWGERHLKGMRFGLLTNPTGIDAQYRPTVEKAAQMKGARLTALFACEHGIRGEKQAGVQFADETDPELGLPVFSLYGEHRRPTAAMLESLDAVVFDIQDLGVRFYTYLTTLVYVMQACAEHGRKVIVLDRPNPLGGNRCGGGYLHENYHSMVGAWRMPIATGLTIGEIATLVNDQMNRPCELQVVPLTGWKREMEYPDTGLPWIMPSPNMPTMDTVRVYAGNCLFEGTNLSEGRGTTRPFEIIGAPWLRHRQLCEQLNGLRLAGVRFHPTTFVPSMSKHAGELCNGVMIFVTDKKSYDPISTSLYMIRQVMELHPQDFRWLPSSDPKSPCFIDILSGSERVRTTLHLPGGLEAILEEWEADRRDWERVRRHYLLYGSD